MAVRREPAPSRVTLRDVARVADVHPGTASRALNVETRSLVNEETARRGVDAAGKVGPPPNPLFPPILRGIEDRLEEDGYTALIANTDNDPERERIDWQAMRARQVDGIVTATARRDHELLDEMLG